MLISFEGRGFLVPDKMLYTAGTQQTLADSLTRVSIKHDVCVSSGLSLTVSNRKTPKSGSLNKIRAYFLNEKSKCRLFLTLVYCLKDVKTEVSRIHLVFASWLQDYCFSSSHCIQVPEWGKCKNCMWQLSLVALYSFRS